MATARKGHQHRCPGCLSADTVSYWDIKRANPGPYDDLCNLVYREFYPDARKCVDCGEVWW